METSLPGSMLIYQRVYQKSMDLDLDSLDLDLASVTRDVFEKTPWFLIIENHVWKGKSGTGSTWFHRGTFHQQTFLVGLKVALPFRSKAMTDNSTDLG